jgi:hypothetical protein
MLQLNPTIEVHTPLGDGEAMFIIDYGINVNTVWVVRLDKGVIKHFYSDDVRIWGNPMNGKGWDCEKLDEILQKLPPGTKRNTDFLHKNNEDDNRKD